MFMTLQIASRFAFTCDEPTSVLLQFEAAQLPEQEVLEASTTVKGAETFNRIAAQNGVGELVSLEAIGRIEVSYEARVKPIRKSAPLEGLTAIPAHKLPSEAVPYLLDSRYCRAEDFHALVESEFDGTQGGARIAAIRDWIAENFTYSPGASGPSTDATDSFIAREGVCRDYAHVLVTLARASTIPARYIACYAPGVTPQDFHAVAEVFLADRAGNEGGNTEGSWHLVDATGMAQLDNVVKIGVGRDAADVSFATSFGPMQFEFSAVDVT